MNCYRAYHRGDNRTHFLFAQTLEDAQASYRTRNGDPAEAEWRDEGEVEPSEDE